MTSKNGADFVQFVMQAQAPASQIGQSRTDELKQNTKKRKDKRKNANEIES